MKKRFLFVFHYTILFLFILALSLILGIYGIKDEKFFLLFCSSFGIAHPFLYLILGTYKEYKYKDYKMPQYAIPSMVTTCVLSVIVLYIFFKVENNGFQKYWWAYNLSILVSVLLPWGIFYIVHRVRQCNKAKTPMLVRNK